MQNFEAQLAEPAELGPWPLLLIDDDEIGTIHSTISDALRSVGLDGPELDRAVAECFRSAVKALQRDRLHERRRRAALKLVPS